MGSGERLEIQTEILNSGEDAFNALLEVQVPRGLNYINANTTDAAVSILCSPPTGRNNKTLVCEVGNPLRAGKKVRKMCVAQRCFFTTFIVASIAEFSGRVTVKRKGKFFYLYSLVRPH
jgi:hypothetical protein